MLSDVVECVSVPLVSQVSHHHLWTGHQPPLQWGKRHGIRKPRGQGHGLKMDVLEW